MHLSSTPCFKKVCHYIFDDNLTKNCFIAIILAYLLFRQQGIEGQFHFPHRTFFVRLSYLRKHRTRKFRYFAICSMLFCEKKINLFHTNVPLIIQLFKMSFLCSYARFLPLSSLVDSRGVHDALLQTIAHINEALLQLINVVQTAFVQSVLHDSPQLIVNGVKALRRNATWLKITKV